MKRLTHIPTWLLIISTPIFIATWIYSPRNTFSGSSKSDQLLLPSRSKDAQTPLLQMHNHQPVDVLLPYTDSICGVEHNWKIAFTFDDGPHHIHTAHLLEILKSHGVVATFFINGYWLHERHPFHARNREIIAQAYEQGHNIGNHTYRHFRLSSLSPEQQTKEIMRNHAIITKATGAPPRFFRPPYSSLTDHAHHLLEQHHYVIAMWSATADDYKIKDPKRIRDDVLRWVKTYRGGIIMLHDRNPWSVEAVELILNAIEKENCRRLLHNEPVYRFVPLDSFLLPQSQSHPLNSDLELDRLGRRHKLVSCQKR